MTSTPLWTANAAAVATGGSVTGTWEATGLTIDSRKVTPGDLYVALRGPNFDGHDFVASALAQGAVAAMVHQAPLGTVDKSALLTVPNTMAGLEKLGLAARARSGAKIVAITGSVGKTGTKDALAHVLGQQGEIVATTGNLNNHIGVPLSLARLTETAEFAVLELGMNHPGEIAPLAQMVRPDVAIITTVTSAHLEFFADEASIADEKAAIMRGLTKDGTVILNRDNAHYHQLVKKAKARGIKHIVGFGAHDGADARLITSEMEYGINEIVAEIGGKKLVYRLGMPGRHWALNSVAVLAAVAAIGGDVEAAAEALVDVVPPKGRGLVSEVDVGGARITVVDDSYNASPAAVNAAIATLRSTAFLPSSSMSPSKIDLVFTSGPLMRHLHDALPPQHRGAYAADSASLIQPLKETLRSGDIVLVKGSLGARMGLVIEGLTSGGAA